ncbi:hypothetical protein Y032_0007g3565 [Ancylostoma ceylanicum]|uniref:Protein-tyrosine phosphatase n=1 Tax=Ancylostoma ceylanicum TaxID=53326 RepID=A0A016VPX1_9BILA|nr:hypothetical protein Y032_0007g3565 [Ancylostoma ceylanicum]
MPQVQNTESCEAESRRLPFLSRYVRQFFSRVARVSEAGEGLPVKLSKIKAVQWTTIKPTVKENRIRSTSPLPYVLAIRVGFAHGHAYAANRRPPLQAKHWYSDDLWNNKNILQEHNKCGYSVILTRSCAVTYRARIHLQACVYRKVSSILKDQFGTVTVERSDQRAPSEVLTPIVIRSNFTIWSSRPPVKYRVDQLAENIMVTEIAAPCNEGAKQAELLEGAYGDSPKNKNGRRSKPSSFKSTKDKNVILGMVSIWVNRVLDMGAPKLIEEFRELSKWKPESMTTKAFVENRALNRYVDVPCQDARRVVLKWPGIENDYIHANYVATPSRDHHFICTQGPLIHTMQHFWAMVIQEKSDYILMLCNTVECEKKKCEQYWPYEVGEIMVFGDDSEGKIVATCVDVHPMSDEDSFIRVSKIRLDYKDGGNEASRTVHHYHWENWPDRGVPPTKLTAINLLAEIRSSTTPIIVHCSAGIGRTGTIVAISYVQEKMQIGEDCQAMSELLKEIRTQRPCSIQNAYQYLYVHRVLLAYFLEKYKRRFQHCLDNGGEEKYQKWCADYKRITGCD